MVGQAARVDQVLLDQRAGHRGQQQRVGAGADEVVLVGLLGGARAARVDDHDLAAALADAPQPAAHVGRGQQAAVRHERVGAEDQQVVGAVHVGHRHRQHRAEHQPGADLLGHLVDRRGRVDVLRAERAQPDRPVRQRGQVVRVRVADVDGHGVAAVLGQQRRQAPVDLLERLVPGRLDQLAVAPDQRRGQAVGVLVQLLEPERLGADEAVAEHVLLVAADRHHLRSLRLHLEPAGGFAERTGAVVERHARSLLLAQLDPERLRGAQQPPGGVEQRAGGVALAAVHRAAARRGSRAARRPSPSTPAAR